ncbi:MAG: imidazole glycerol phosphate synthase subunit HisH [Clostridia bacterium]
MIAIIDYGVGNLASVEKAVKFIGFDAGVTGDTDKILKADAVLLPGVGAFNDAMNNLKKANIIDAIKSVINDGRPFLGICLGMQMLFEYSEEGGGNVEGLGIFEGSVKQIPSTFNLKVPHMGWNSIKVKDDCDLFKGLPENPYVYFVHSYCADAKDRNIIAATTEYGIEFDSAVGRKNVFATQFHPEKSGEIGLEILKNWAQLS